MSYLTIAEVQHAQARKLTDLDARSVLLTGQALSLGDPRDIAGHIMNLASLVVINGATDDLVDAIGAQAIALRLALARVETLDVTSGNEAA